MKMRVKNKAIVMLIVLIFVMSFSLIAFAEPKGEIFVHVADNMEIQLYKVADYDGKNYSPGSGLETSGVSINAILNNPSPEAAEDLFEYMKDNDIECQKKRSKDKVAVFSSLQEGIWLVCAEDSQELVFKPFIVFLPYEENDELIYSVEAIPKIEEGITGNISFSVMKKWDDKQNEAGKRPDSVTVEILSNKKVVETVNLSEKNGWAFTFYTSDEGGAYSVREKDVEGYIATYSGDEKNGFIITNVYDNNKLPQTGQMWWPIAIILVAGAACVALGIIELRNKDNEKAE